MAKRATKAVNVNEEGIIELKAPNIMEVELEIRGTSPLVQHKFSKKVIAKMLNDQQDVAPKKGKKVRVARDPRQDFLDAQHIAEDGWNGIPVTAIKSAMVRACSLVGLEMKANKLSIFVVADGVDVTDGTPLVRLDAGPPEMHEGYVRIAMGSTDLRFRPMWREWAAKVRIQFDADMITANSVGNLLDRAGRQVGIGEGRNDSKQSLAGMGWGSFQVVAGG
jgi:hypothetical protein